MNGGARVAGRPVQPEIPAILLAQAWGAIVTIWGGIVALDLKGGATIPLSDFPWVALAIGVWAAINALTLFTAWWCRSRKWTVVGLGWSACVFGGTALALAHDGITASAGWAACWTILAAGSWLIEVDELRELGDSR